MKQKIIAIFRIMLIAIFIVYYGEGAFFVHTHKYGNYSVTHSHPYAADSHGAPRHGHTASQLATIFQLTHLIFFFNVVAPVIGLAVLSYLLRYVFNAFIYFHLFPHYISLRAPPARRFFSI